MKGYVFRQSNPAIVGAEIEIGKIKVGDPIMAMDGRRISSVKSMREGQDNVNVALQGKQIAMAMEGVTVGRQVNEGDFLYSDIDEKTYMRRDRKRKNLKVPVKRKSGRMIKDEMTTTASIPNPADTAMGPNTIHDKRRKKDKKPVLLKRFRKYIEDNGIGEECEECQFDHVIMEAEYQGKQVKLNDPIRTSENPNKKFKVYTKGPNGNIVVVRFGDPNMSIKRDDPNRRKSFRARHNCDNPGPKYKARYWSCYQWRANAPVDN